MTGETNKCKGCFEISIESQHVVLDIHVAKHLTCYEQSYTIFLWGHKQACHHHILSDHKLTFTIFLEILIRQVTKACNCQIDEQNFQMSEFRWGLI